MKSMPAKHGPQSNPWDATGVRQTTQTGGRTTSAAARSIARQVAPGAGLGSAIGSVTPIHMASIIECPCEPEEAL